jgi:hypothetical protein
MSFHFPGNCTTLPLLAAASCVDTTAATGTGVDLRGYEGLCLVVQNHGVSTGTLNGKIQDSADNSTFADVAGLTFTQSTTTADTKALFFNVNQVRRYVRYVGTVGTGPQIVGVTLSADTKNA